MEQGDSPRDSRKHDPHTHDRDLRGDRCRGYGRLRALLWSSRLHSRCSCAGARRGAGPAGRRFGKGPDSGAGWLCSPSSGNPGTGGWGGAGARRPDSRLGGKAPEAIAAAGKKVQEFRHRFDRLSALVTPPQGAPSSADSSRSSASTDSSRGAPPADQAHPAPSSASPGPALRHSSAEPSGPPRRSSAS